MLELLKLKAVAGDEIIITENLKFILERVENIVGKKEKMLATSIFSFSPTMFSKASVIGVVKLWIVW